jgi:hypothetical protein
VDEVVILNFGPPLFPAHLRQIQQVTGEEVEQVLDVDVSGITDDRPLVSQVLGVLDQLGFTAAEWGRGSFLLHLPRSGALAATLLAAVAHRTNRFPRLVRAKPYGAVDVVDLQELGTPSPRPA